MSDHLEGPISGEIRSNKTLVFPVPENTKSRLAGKIRYCWCWVSASLLLLFVALPALLFLFVINKRLWLYPLALWGARTWLEDRKSTRLNSSHVKTSHAVFCL